ncbi:MAG: 2-oxo acid dehydrogenase subunit E2 [Candidatus Dormibacteraeota bacterium]|nr:2-oxo acid dehydrogenase subunit E2 [Candidatus Dormibacteraeota bacterium]
MSRAVDVHLPKLADTLVEGTVSRWLKRAGDTVAKGEPLVEIETDKVNSELESPASGVITEILAAEGETVAVGSVIARIADDNGSPAAGREPEPVQRPAQTDAGTGSGTAGLSQMRRRIAERMQEARATIPQGACVREFDLSGVERSGSWTAYFVKALAAAAAIQNIGVAVEVPDGLVVPVVKDAAGRSTGEITATIDELASRARSNQLQPADVLDGGFTVTNVGGGGALMAFPLVNPGQPGILAPGSVRADGRCFVTLCYDRRSLDDYAADRLLAGIEREMARL